MIGHCGSERAWSVRKRRWSIVVGIEQMDLSVGKDKRLAVQRGRQEFSSGRDKTAPTDSFSEG